MTQATDILNHLKTKGPITQLEALKEYGCFRLASRINELRESGHDITTTRITTDSGARPARYIYAGKPS